jgi:acyl carrier protein
VVAPLPEITAILREMLGDNQLELTPATRFDELTDWDSMDLVTVVVEAECRFHVQFELAEIDRLSSVGDLMRMVEAKQAVASA